MVAKNPKRKGKGRQKIAMVRIEKESNRFVTFSKRRVGLFKKTSELCTLSGAEAAIIIFSPGQKAYSFGHPVVDTVVDRFLGVSDTDNPNLDVARQNADSVSRLNMELTLLQAQIKGERKYGEELVNMRKFMGEETQWLTSLEDLKLARLKELFGLVNDLQNNVFGFGHQLLNVVTPNPIPSSFTVPNSVASFEDPPFPLGSLEMGPIHPMGGFGTQDMISFEGKFDGGATMPFDIGMNDPLMSGNQEDFTSLLMGFNPLEDPSAPPFKPQGEFGFGPALF